MSDVMKWLQDSRKLDGQLLADMGVRQVDHPQMGQAVVFPYSKGGEGYAGKFRTEDKQFRSTQGVTRGLYNADALKCHTEQPIVITEGEIDCLTVIQSGFARAVSIPDGWTEQGNKNDALIEAKDDLLKSPYVIVAGDNDEAGESLPRAVANILKGHDVRSVKWPAGCKDANDVLMMLGEGEVSQCLNEARRMDPPGGFITGISDLPPMSTRRILKVGMDPFDWRMAFELGAMSVVTGMPGNGKSTLITWAADEISRNENVRIGMMAYETHPYQIRDHLARIRTGRKWDDLNFDQQAELATGLDKHWKIVHRTFTGPGHNLGWLEEMIYTLAVRDQCKMIIIDPWNEIEHLPEPGESMTSYINFALKEIRTWAEKLEVHICVVAHPRKMPTDGKPRAPTGYDVADSAAFANKPSLGLTVHQAQDKDGMPVVEIVTWKVRNTQLYGFERGKAQVEFDQNKMIYRRL